MANTKNSSQGIFILTITMFTKKSLIIKFKTKHFMMRLIIIIYKFKIWRTIKNCKLFSLFNRPYSKISLKGCFVKNNRNNNNKNEVKALISKIRYFKIILILLLKKMIQYYRREVIYFKTLYNKKKTINKSN